MHSTEHSETESNTAPLISIVLPVYNGERFLSEALDAVLAQSFRDFELIVVDDCSTDSSPEILRSYAERDSRIRIITNENNRKLPASLNVGFAAAKGDWLSWTSDDNVPQPHMLQRLIEAAKSHPEADIIHANYQIIDEEGSHGPEIHSRSADNILLDNVIGCCFLYRREVDRKLNGYDEDLFGIEDYDFWIRAWKAGLRFHHVPETLYLYRRHGGSLTMTKTRQIYELVHQRLMREAAELPRGRQRAEVELRLLTRDYYTLRFRSLLAALYNDPLTVVKGWRAIIYWLRTSLSLRVRQR